MSENPKFLGFDIETSNLFPDKGRIMCAAFINIMDGNKITVFREDEKRFRTKRTGDDKELVTAIRDFMGNAFVWMSYYGRAFDIRFIQTRLRIAGEWPLEYRKHIDLYYYTGGSALKLERRSLRVLAERFDFKIGKKDVSFPDWMIAGNERYNPNCRKEYKRAIQEVVDHCIRDVELLPPALMTLYPFVGTIKR
jgi:uncharacterized protein YprB with RNaseH-like and TPR domain